MSDLRETTGITRTPEAETISSLKADLAAERAATSKLLADKGNLSRAIFEADDAMEKLEAEVSRLRESNKELAAALREGAEFLAQFHRGRELRIRMEATLAKATEAGAASTQPKG